MIQATWLLIANAAYARLYALNKNRLLQEPKLNTEQAKQNINLLNEYSHPESRKKISDLTADKLGGFNNGTFVDNQSPKQHEADKFAQEIIEKLDLARKSNNFKDIIIIAPPTFLGLLNKYMPSCMQKFVSKTIEKDYIKCDDHELLTNIVHHL
jgi:protein required for attachment to host cells